MLYADQTEHALHNFGESRMPRDFIRAYGEVKKACLLAIQEYNTSYDPEVYDAIIKALDEIIAGAYDEHFVLPFKQGGAGTSINMNVNEVAAGLANIFYKEKTGKDGEIDPIKDINKYQSTNDTYPTALTVMLYRHLLTIEQKVIALQERLALKESEYAGIVMTGRTQLQAALPITLGQVFGGFAGALERDRWRLNKLKERIRTIALGGTAMGTCFAAPARYVFSAEQKLRQLTGLPLCRSQNLVDEIANHDNLAELASGYNLLALNLFKITGDLLLYSSSFVNEIKHPDLQYGSTIMAAKTNPVSLEFVRGLAVDISGEYHKIITYCSNGQLQLNAFVPFITGCFINIYQSLTTAIDAFVDKFLDLMEIKTEVMERNLVGSNAVLNSLLPVLGYAKIKEIYGVLEKYKPADFDSLKALIKEHTDLSDEVLDECFDVDHLTSYGVFDSF